jgi:hypothetical protein
MTAAATARPPAAPIERPVWLVALDGLCRPCADAEFYGIRMRHARCERGDCQCQVTVSPAECPPGTWPA